MRIAFAVILLCLTPILASCAGTQNIVGKWQSAENPKATYEFLKDGTFITADEVGSTVGTYKYVDDKRIKIETPGVGGRLLGTSVFEISISEDELLLKFEAGPLAVAPGKIFRYRRIK